MTRKLFCIALALATVLVGLSVLCRPGSGTAQKSTAALAREILIVSPRPEQKSPADPKSAAAPADPKSAKDLRTSYFDGMVKAEYRRAKSDDNAFTVMFYEKGTYRVSFAEIPGTSNRSALPRTIDLVVEATPQTKVFQGGVPDCFRATITRKKVSEFHDFPKAE